MARLPRRTQETLEQLGLIAGVSALLLGIASALIPSQLLLELPALSVVHWYIRLWWPSTVWQFLSLLCAAVLFVFGGRLGIAFGLAWVVSVGKAFAPEPEREGFTDYFPPGVWLVLGLIFGPLVLGAGGLSLGLAGILRFFYAVLRLIMLGSLRP